MIRASRDVPDTRTRLHQPTPGNPGGNKWSKAWLRRRSERKRSDVLTISDEATIDQAAQLMYRGNVGALVVIVMADAEVIGILYSRDIVAGVAIYRERLNTVTVGELMRHEI